MKMNPGSPKKYKEKKKYLSESMEVNTGKHVTISACKDERKMENSNITAIRRHI
jgi:hypothetical protein